MIVADASVVMLGLLGDGESRRRLASEAIAVPHLVDSEVMHVLRREVGRGGLGAEHASRLVAVWSRFGVQRFPLVGLLERMWALREHLSAYDAGYVALAEALHCDLVTADARLASAPGPTCSVVVVRD